MTRAQYNYFRFLKKEQRERRADLTRARRLNEKGEDWCTPLELAEKEARARVADKGVAVIKFFLSRGAGK